jgi:O-antigen/teichoic acid export membrane protein
LEEGSEAIMKSESFLRHAAVYGLASLLVQAAGFVLLPLYTRCMSKEDFGALEVVVRLAETVSTVLLFGGLRQALLTFYQQADDEQARRRFVGSALLLVVAGCVVGGVIALPLSGPLSLWLGGTDRGLRPDLIRLAVLGILLEPLSLLPMALFQARMRSTTFVWVTVGQFLVRVTLSVAFVAGLGWGAMGVLAATAMTGALFGGALTIRELRHGAAWPDAQTLRSFLAFSLPFLPGGLCFFVLHHGDRFFLLRSCGEAEVGTYGLGYRLAMAVGMFSLTPLYQVWAARMYDVARREDAALVFGRALTRILGAYLFVGLGLVLFQDEAVALLGGRAYAEAATVVAPVLLACLFQAASSLMDAAFYIRRRTGLKLGITLAATAVMLFLYATLIPAWGSVGAALATLGGFAFLAVCTYFVTQRIFPVRYEWGRLLTAFALALGLWLAARGLPLGSWSIAAKAGLWLLWPSLLWLAGIVSSGEKQQLLALLGSIRAWLRRTETSPIDGAKGSQHAPVTAA